MQFCNGTDSVPVLLALLDNKVTFEKSLSLDALLTLNTIFVLNI